MTDQTGKAIAPASGGSRPTSLLLVIFPYTVESTAKTAQKGVRSFLAFPYGVLTLASYIRSHASHPVDIHILDLNTVPLCDAPATLREALDRHRPDIVGMSLMFDVSYKHVEHTARVIKTFDPSILLILGGASATASYNEILEEQPDIDAICYGEGELAITTLVDAADPWREIEKDPWVTRESLHKGKKPSSRTVDNLNEVIDVDYGLIDIQAYSMKEAFSPFVSAPENAKVQQFFLITSRGCPFKCVFCAEPSFHGKSVRYADVDAIIGHIDMLASRYGMNVLTIYDDQLLLDKRRAKELFRRLAPYKLRIEIPNGVTAILIDEELAGLMKNAGVDSIYLAIESGSESVLKNIIKKPIRLDKIQPIVKSLHDAEIFVQAFFINGFPGETEQDRQKTLTFIKQVGIDWSLFNFASPLRGSELYRICKENGWIEQRFQKIGDLDMTEYVIRAPGIDPLHIEMQTYRMNLEVNFVNNYRMRIGDFDTAARCFEEVIRRHPRHPLAHYYLARAFDAQGHDVQRIRHHRQIYNDIVAQDPDWSEHIAHFGLPRSVPVTGE
ncbi:radical SAM domain iron-sulfur cluster-binding oxidoreductase with cobalamin-binding-like domain and TPR domain [Syntrophotalea carbinolica DSM 2380]|uniref:Radical SAM domain iron-sulfur cluster-binding oxidoreductase with cobalamin-binding-like domain and TPR domain n=1 Tax=Syntrophotalea carbinolica (strain DSM 2380 / NBRC 103641 / GraBd1) TaxID=338963 RepID=Q3A5I3_SYNC1|nr:B12-binding domain-containing radical SAM protein [Syntrophotalea carbinolica]ABA88374.1 radical SAM domain iron-sulfur cluster-binding oxidoreductase with cobalamin-binding-like domain and TPR domain [Syntrophotalea carbinolica DSM 2380]